MAPATAVAVLRARYRLQFLHHELHSWNWEDDRIRRNRDLFDVDLTSVEPKEIT